jgi:hypothetical protein
MATALNTLSVSGRTLRADAGSYTERACSLAALVALDRDLYEGGTPWLDR